MGLKYNSDFKKKNIRLLFLCIGMYLNMLLKLKMLCKIFKKKVFIVFIDYNKDY